MPGLNRIALALWIMLVPQIGSAQTDLALCEAATPQFPQACPCVITRSEAAGITGPVLARLLANDVGDVPIQTFQAYGAIYVACIQEAVTGGVPAVPAPVPTPEPAPAVPEPAAPSGGGGSPVITGAVIPDYDAPAVTMRMLQPVSAGTWETVIIEHGYGGFSGPGVHDGGGHVLMLRCAPTLFSTSADHMVLGGVAPRSGRVVTEITVTRGNGSVLVRQPRGAMPANGPFLLLPLDRALAGAIRAGSELRMTVEGEESVSFGLSGSGRAVSDMCGTERPRLDSYIASGAEVWVPNGAWARTEVRRDGAMVPLVTFDVREYFVPRIGFTCDRRLAVLSPIFGYGTPHPGSIVVGPFNSGAPQYPVTFRAGPGGLITDPLDPALLERLTQGGVMTLSFNDGTEPGGGTVIPYPLDGLAEGLAGFACPPPPPEPAATARTDLTGQGYGWTPGDIGPALPANPDGTVARFPVASFNAPAEFPGLSVGCDGVPFFAGGDWNFITGDLRLTLDGDPATSFDQEYGSYRAFLNPGGFPMDLTPRILDGGTLRVMSVQDPALDILFPLGGLPAALAEAGC